MNKPWIWLALAAAILMAASSAAGVFLPATYAKETASWAAQGVGQDAANLFVVFPAVLIALHFAYRGSVRAGLVSLGLLIYIVYSYLLYSFFVHFGPWFLAYVTILGLSTYAAAGAALQLGWSVKSASVRLPSVLMFAFGLLFAALWLLEIIPALIAGRAPAGVSEIGAPVNPVHVIDLAFILPGMIATAAALRKRKPLGFLFAAPLLVFSAVMGLALLAMFYVLHARGLAVALGPIVAMGVVALLSLYGAYLFLRGLQGLR